MRIEWLRPDFMHMVDLGITQYLSGNVCLVPVRCFGRAAPGALLALRAVCAQIRKMADVPVREDALDGLHLNLTVSKFRAQNKPKLALKSRRRTALLADPAQGAPALLPAGSPRERVMVGCVETPVRHLQGA